MASNLEKVINIAKEISGEKTSISFNGVSFDSDKSESKPEQLSLFASDFMALEQVFLSEIVRFDPDGKVQKIKVKVFEPADEDAEPYLKISGKIFEDDVPELIGYIKRFGQLSETKRTENEK